MKRIALCLLLILPLAGCASFDRATFNTLSVSNSVLKTAQVDYETGKLPHTACVYNLINRGKTMQNVTETAFLDEWTTEQAKGDVAASQAALAADLADLAPVVLSLKTLYTNPNCTGGAQ